MTAESDIAAIDDGGANTAAEVRTALTSTLARADSSSGARIHKNGTNQDNVTQGAIVQVTFSTASFDTDSYFNDANDSLVIPTTSLYLVVAGVGFADATDAEDLLGLVTVDDVTAFQFGRMRHPTGTSLVRAIVQYSGSDILALSAGEELNLKVYTETAAGTNTVDISGDATETYLAVARLGLASV